MLGGMEFDCEFGFESTNVTVHTCVVEDLRCFFVEAPEMFTGNNVYVGWDDYKRFDFFSRVGGAPQLGGSGRGGGRCVGTR